MYIRAFKIFACGALIGGGARILAATRQDLDMIRSRRHEIASAIDQFTFEYQFPYELCHIVSQYERPNFKLLNSVAGGAQWRSFLQSGKALLNRNGTAEVQKRIFQCEGPPCAGEMVACAIERGSVPAQYKLWCVLFYPGDEYCKSEHFAYKTTVWTDRPRCQPVWGRAKISEAEIADAENELDATALIRCNISHAAPLDGAQRRLAEAKLQTQVRHSLFYGSTTDGGAKISLYEHQYRASFTWSELYVFEKAALGTALTVTIEKGSSK